MPVPQLVQGKAVTIVASADVSLRQRVRGILEGLRWNVVEAGGGAEAFACMEEQPCEALLLDGWLPDLEVNEFIREFQQRYPDTDLVMVDGDGTAARAKSTGRRQELLYAMRRGRDDDGARAVNVRTIVQTAEPGKMAGLSRDIGGGTAASGVGTGSEAKGLGDEKAVELCEAAETPATGGAAGASATRIEDGRAAEGRAHDARAQEAAAVRLPELVGESPAMLELCRMIRLVAPRRTTVLIEGPTGSGKELVAGAIHRLSPRSRSPFVVLNCAAIPDALLEAELFGHTRGAFTGAVQARTGRLEAAHGGTLFLDEIGEMPLALQAKLLRFLEQGELQRVGENEPLRVDVRVVAATHQPLAERVEEGSFRADFYFRLAVFPLQVPSLESRRDDIPLLVAHFLQRLGADAPAKRIALPAVERLLEHDWPGGVRELQHVLERAYILAGERSEIDGEDIRFATRLRRARAAVETPGAGKSVLAAV